MFKAFTGIIIIWYALTWAVTYEDFAAEADVSDTGLKRFAIWTAFIVYPAVVPFALAYAVVVNSAKVFCLAVKYVFSLGRHKHSGEVFLTQRKYRDGKRRRGRREFNHYGRD